MVRTAVSFGAVILLLLELGGRARAQEPQAETAIPDDPDPTRLDVERLPPEAIEITRELYSHGLFVEGWVGGRGFVGGLGEVSDPGLFANVGVGYELLSWLLVRAAIEASIHATDAPAPPSPTVFELLGVVGEVRLQGNLSARAALWLSGEVAMLYATGDVLRAYGFDQSGSVGMAYGGSAGFDWHMANRHHSIGLLGGARLHPSLDRPGGDRSIGIHGAAYIRYVF